MISDILTGLASLIISVISATGYAGIVFLMTLESACIPLPSEVVMPFSGYLVSVGQFSIFGVALAATVGNLIGSLVAYAVGYYGGRPLAQKYGQYLLIREDDLLRAERWFKKYGSSAVFFSRLLPIVRTFISLPVGVAKMDIKKFIAYTFLGSLPWNFFLAYVGLKLGQNWKSLGTYFHKFDIVIAAAIVLAIIWWLWRHLVQKNK
jgi:membrane protein DedA with SNARE-associated domain